MNRDIRGEVLVALVAIALLGFALAFGVLVSLSEPDDDIIPTGETATMVVVDSNVDSATSTLRPMVNSTSIESAMVTSTVTETSQGATETRRVDDTPTETSILSSITPDKPTETPTATEMPPTMTATPTVTPRPTRTPLPSHTPSNTPRPTEFALILPTSTLDAMVRSSPVACVAPDRWVRYTVPGGTTLFSIAQSVGSSISELQTANCLADPARIISGDVLFVPRIPVLPLETAVQVDHFYRLGCGNPAVQIRSPGVGQSVSGSVPVTGSAVYGDQFGYYKLEIRPDTNTVYNFYARSETPVRDDVLAYLDTSLFDPGTYWLRLVVVDRTGNIPADATCVIPIVID